MKIKNFSIRSKLSLISLIFVILAVMLTLLSTYSYNYIMRNYQKVKDCSVPNLIAIFEAKNACRRSFICVKQFLETGDSNNINSFKRNLGELEVWLSRYYDENEQNNTGSSNIKKILSEHKVNIESNANIIFSEHRKKTDLLLELDRINDQLDDMFQNIVGQQHSPVEKAVIDSKNLYAATVSFASGQSEPVENSRKKKILQQLEAARQNLLAYCYTSRNNEPSQMQLLMERLLDKSNQIIESDVKIFAEDKKMRQLETNAINVLNWAIIYENDDLGRQTSAVASLIELSKITLVILAAIFTLFALLISSLFSKKIVNLISSLVQSTKIMAKGNFNHRNQIHSSDEIGILADSFNKMAEELEKQVAWVDNLNKEMVERRNAEEMLKEANEQLAGSNRELMLLTARLEEANNEMKDFVYIASHDLREPLRKVTSFGSILKESLKDKLTGDDKENLKYMIDGADRMTKMIEGLLTYSRISSKEVPLEEVDLNEIVEQLKQIELAKMIEETAAVIETPERLPKITANAAQIRQLFQNLVANGIKYHVKDVRPQIIITTKQENDGQVRIEVQDNGIGIEEKYYEDIFKMFRRLHSRREYEGTGIGLAVCKKIVERHNGKIGVISKLGEGSTFWFTLPVKNALKNEQTEQVLVETI